MPVTITDLNFDITTLIIDSYKSILESEKVSRASQVRSINNLALSIPSPCWLQSVRKHFWTDGCFTIPGEPKGHLEEMKRLFLPGPHSTMLLAASHIRELKYTPTDALERYKNRNEAEISSETGCSSLVLDCPPTGFLEWCASTYPEHEVATMVTVAQKLFSTVVKLTIEDTYMLDDRIPPGADLSERLQKHQKAHSLTSEARTSLLTSFAKISILYLSGVSFSSPEQLYELLRELRELRDVELVACWIRKDNKRVYAAKDELPLPSPPLGLLRLERTRISDLDFAGGLIRSFHSCPNIRKIEVTKARFSDYALLMQSLNGLCSSCRELESIVLLEISAYHSLHNGEFSETLHFLH
ncbi:hypothetical protein V5O48_001153 [Marasmius crinis-equi]|uniref:Uncharacterized protein n=1 Tax=Marasmius crinis-equi TaxID=585013 RepID=A0ABR3FZ79_9AGAR